MTEALLWPADILPSSQSMFIRNAVAQFASPFSAGVQAVSRKGGERWVSQMTFQRLSRSKSGQLDAFIARMRGGAIPVCVPNFRRRYSAEQIDLILLDPNILDDAPFQEGILFQEGFGWRLGQLTTAAANATRITTHGWRAGEVVMRPGDAFEITGGRMHIYTGGDDLRADAEGEAEIEFFPPLRSPVAEGDAIVLELPCQRMHLRSPDQAANATVKPAFSNYQLEFIEALP
jgi:hypothetical protein